MYCFDIINKCRPINPLDSKGNYSATSNNTKLVHWPLVGGLLHLVQPTHQRPVYQSLYCYMMVRCSAVLMWRLHSKGLKTSKSQEFTNSPTSCRNDSFLNIATDVT